MFDSVINVFLLMLKDHYPLLLILHLLRHLYLYKILILLPTYYEYFSSARKGCFLLSLLLSVYLLLGGYGLLKHVLHLGICLSATSNIYHYLIIIYHYYIIIY